MKAKQRTGSGSASSKKKNAFLRVSSLLARLNKGFITHFDVQSTVCRGDWTDYYGQEVHVPMKYYLIEYRNESWKDDGISEELKMT